MNVTVIWALALVVVVVAIAIGVIVMVAQARARARNEQNKRTVATPCVASGHNYRIFETGWRCDTCGNYVSRVEGEEYGPEQDGLRERRREPR
ncbi:MAG: hypothetical protein ABI662_02695 [Dermatophilaceae bacterium]